MKKIKIIGFSVVLTTILLCFVSCIFGSTEDGFVNDNWNEGQNQNFVWRENKNINYNVKDGVVGDVSFETYYNWISYYSETSYMYETTRTTSYNEVQHEIYYSSTRTGYSNFNGQYTRNGQTSTYVLNIFSDITSIIDYVSDIYPDSTTSTVSEWETTQTLYLDFGSGLISQINTITTNSTNNSAPTVSQGDTYYNIEFLYESGGEKTYKYYSTSINGYTVYKIKYNITLETKTYSDSGVLFSTTTYSLPYDAAIRAKLPGIRLNNTFYESTPENNSYQTCEVLSDSDTLLVIRHKTYTNNVLTSQLDTYYEKYIFQK